MRRLVGPFTAIALSGTALACTTSDPKPALTCPAPTEAQWLPDSSAGLCLPPGFEPHGPWRFARSRGDTLPEHWISVRVRPHPALDPGEQWPLRLASPGYPCPDCTTAEDVMVRRDSIAGVAAYLELGRVSGGISGERQAPALVTSLDGRPAWTAVVNGRSASVIVRDSLAAALATLRVYPARVRVE